MDRATKIVPMTLCYIVCGEEVLLGRKNQKHTIGGKLVGFGGLFDTDYGTGETPVKATIRECFEETGIRLRSKQLSPHSHLWIYKKEGDAKRLLFDIFVMVARVKKKPPRIILNNEFSEAKWYPIDRIPFDELPQDDELWLPRVLRGETLSILNTRGLSREHFPSTVTMTTRKG